MPGLLPNHTKKADFPKHSPQPVGPNVLPICIEIIFHALVTVASETSCFSTVSPGLVAAWVGGLPGEGGVGIGWVGLQLL